MSIKINLDGFQQFQDQRDNSLFEKSFLEKKLEDFNSTINSPEYGFFKLTETNQYLEECQSVFEAFSHIKTFVQVGIGGSSLGPEMLVSALQKDFSREFIFINNIDPDCIFDQLRNIETESTLFYFVSKSGGTAETMSSLAIISQMLMDKGVAQENLNDYFVFATDPVKSQLLELGSELNIKTLTIPSNIGGRFSVFTPVGLLPALFAGLDAYELLEGANKIKESLLNKDVEENPLLQSASWLFNLGQKGFGQTVFMPYSSKLRDLAFWFTQLWAESLGKRLDKEGNVVNTGLTPIPAYGATDQHSQVQLFMEGPFDKVLMMIEVENFKHDFSLKSSWAKPSLEKLKNHNLSELMKAEFQGTLKALSEAKRPFLHIGLQENNENNLGSLVMFLESLTALMGHYFNIDPFDQPGVEAGKRFAFEYLTQGSSK